MLRGDRKGHEMGVSGGRGAHLMHTSAISVAAAAGMQRWPPPGPDPGRCPFYVRVERAKGCSFP
jgi:hypothetical protein